jgi:hypothetical protein
MELNIITFGYLFFRLAPFILTCFFTLASIFNQDFKGFVLLVGLLLACFIGSMIGRVFNFQTPSAAIDNNLCNMITIGQMENLSQLPLGQVVLSYIFFYLMIFIGLNKVFMQNVATLIFFPLLIIIDAIWNMNNSCFSVIQIFVAIIVGGVIGSLWGWVIYSTKSQNLQYFAGYSNNQVCNKPSKNTFKCSVYKNGKLLSSSNI